ncbi:MAG: PIN domain nuclease, partial [Gemmatimonadetes bacterium]|nr:PIN domain nuclease [Gemmatimonadota bacterium]
MSTVLLDSVVVIDVLNDVPEAVQYLREVRDVSVVSAVTRAEVLVGYPDDESIVAIDLLDRFPAMGVDGPVA